MTGYSYKAIHNFNCDSKRSTLHLQRVKVSIMDKIVTHLQFVGIIKGPVTCVREKVSKKNF